MRMQRCSISAVCGYSAWSMKLACSVSAISCVGLGLHPGGHEGREVARRAARRAASPRSTSPSASSAGMPVFGQLVVGRRLEQVAVAVDGSRALDLPRVSSAAGRPGVSLSFCVDTLPSSVERSRGATRAAQAPLVRGSASQRPQSPIRTEGTRWRPRRRLQRDDDHDDRGDRERDGSHREPDDRACREVVVGAATKRLGDPFWRTPPITSTTTASAP